ncbi:MAG: hypothetical protein M0Z36_14810, partial [Thermaerobacter sp.]|nr:hypothetical protein [Thermaerobacter sp.]
SHGGLYYHLNIVREIYSGYRIFVWNAFVNLLGYADSVFGKSSENDDERIWGASVARQDQ